MKKHEVEKAAFVIDCIMRELCPDLAQWRFVDKEAREKYTACEIALGIMRGELEIEDGN